MKFNEEKIYGLIFSLPFFIIFIIFIIYPLVIEICYAFFEKEIGGKLYFVGLKNFYETINSVDFQRAVINTALYVGVGVNTKMLLSLLIANFLNIRSRFQRFLRVLFILPWAMATVPALINWRWIFDLDFGLANLLLKYMGYSNVNWLGNYNTAIALIILFHIWKWTPLWTLILLSGLQGIPVNIIEAAKIDGASGLRIFYHITWPLIKRLYILLTVLSTIWVLGQFEVVWVLTRGGPAQSTHVIATLAYRELFELWNAGKAASILVLVLPITIILILFLIHQLER